MRERQHASLLLIPMVLAVVSTRLLLFLLPEAGHGLGGIHVHHLLVGTVLMTIAGVPALIGRPDSGAGRLGPVTFGAGLGLALDEWVLLVARESNPTEPYQSPLSLVGSLGLMTLVLAYTLWLDRRTARVRTPGTDASISSRRPPRSVGAPGDGYIRRPAGRRTPR